MVPRAAGHSTSRWRERMRGNAAPAILTRFPRGVRSSD